MTDENRSSGELPPILEEALERLSYVLMNGLAGVDGKRDFLAGLGDLDRALNRMERFSDSEFRSVTAFGSSVLCVLLAHHWFTACDPFHFGSLERVGRALRSRKLGDEADSFDELRDRHTQLRAPTLRTERQQDLIELSAAYLHAYTTFATFPEDQI